MLAATSTTKVTTVSPMIPTDEVLTAQVTSPGSGAATNVAEAMPAKCTPDTASPITTALAILNGDHSRVSVRKRNARHNAASEARTRITTDSATMTAFDR